MRHDLTTEIEIEAPPDVVWDVLSDLEAYAQWNPFVVESRGTLAEGERLTNRLQPPGGRAMTFRPVLTEVSPGRALEWLGRLGVPGLFDGRHRFELREVDDQAPEPRTQPATQRATGASSRTAFTQRESFSGLLVRPLRRSLDTSTRAGFVAMNEALKARAEERAGERR